MSNEDFTLPIKRKAKPVRESKIEAAGKARVEAAGGISAKFVSPGHRARPDQIEFYGISAMQKVLRGAGIFMGDDFVRGLLASAIQLTEYKAPGKKPTTAQLREHEMFRALGFTVNVVDSI